MMPPPTVSERSAHGASWRPGALMVGVVMALCVAWSPAPEALPPQAQRAAAVAVLMAVWWVLEALPAAVVALVPLVGLPLLTGAGLRSVAASYAHPLLYLMLGGFVLGHAMQRVGLHERLVAVLLAPGWVRRSPRRVLGALMLATALLSGVVSNTATTLMLLPLAMSLADRCATDRTAVSVRPAFVLGLAYSASLGGLLTLVGTPPNAVLAGLAPELAGVDIGFARWLGLGVPVVAVLLPLAWWLLTRGIFDVPERPASTLVPPRLPAWRPGERTVLALTAIAFVLWLTRADKDLGGVVVPGWGPWLSRHGIFAGSKGSELDAWVAMAVAVSLFVLPRRSETGEAEAIIGWKDAEAAIPWGVIVLLGGGFALAGAVASSGLTAWLASGAGALRGLPDGLTVLALCVVITFVTELTSNTATTQIALPLLAEAAAQAQVAPLVWMVPATVSASCAFMMPVATAPNAIVSGSGWVSNAQMARAGLGLNVAGACAIAMVCWLLTPYLF